jgi:hypothetical protein
MTLRFSRPAIVAFLLFTAAAPLLADWYDDYLAGTKAAQKGQWHVVVDKMSSAIGSKPKEDDKARPYGNIFVKYHPYYYRGAAWYELGQYQKAVDDLNRATGAGDVQLQSLETLQMKAQAKLSQPPTPPPVNPTNPPPPTNTVAPSLPPPVDTAMEQARQRANGALAQANTSRNTAQSAKATTLAPAAFVQATETLSEARTRAASARTAAEWQDVGQLADRARTQFDASLAQAQLAAKQPSIPAQATNAVLADTRAHVRRALDAYFNGDYPLSTREFQRMASAELRQNAMIWMFLGASQYSQYYLGGEQSSSLRAASIDSFRHAKILRRNLTELPSQYFSPRIRRFFRSVH